MPVEEPPVAARTPDEDRVGSAKASVTWKCESGRGTREETSRTTNRALPPWSIASTGSNGFVGFDAAMNLRRTSQYISATKMAAGSRDGGEEGVDLVREVHGEEAVGGSGRRRRLLLRLLLLLFAPSRRVVVVVVSVGGAVSGLRLSALLLLLRAHGGRGGEGAAAAAFETFFLLLESAA